MDIDVRRKTENHLAEVERNYRNAKNQLDSCAAGVEHAERKAAEWEKARKALVAAVKSLEGVDKLSQLVGRAAVAHDAGGFASGGFGGAAYYQTVHGDYILAQLRSLVLAAEAKVAEAKEEARTCEADSARLAKDVAEVEKIIAGLREQLAA